jgi:hypothetical protein
LVSEPADNPVNGTPVEVQTVQFKGCENWIVLKNGMSKRNKKDLAPRLEEIKDGGDSNQDKESNGVTQEDKEDLLIQLDEYPPLIDVEIVEAVCTSIKREFYAWGTQSEVFKFRVYDPPQCEGLVMPMYVPLGSWWKNGKRPPRSSKLAKVAKVGGCRRKFTKSTFVGKAFRCHVIATKGDVPYSVIRMILEKLTG